MRYSTFAKVTGSSWWTRFPIRKRIHVFPDFGYETMNTSPGSTVNIRPAMTLPVATVVTAFTYCAILSFRFLTLVFVRCHSSSTDGGAALYQRSSAAVLQ